MVNFCFTRAIRIDIYHRASHIPVCAIVIIKHRLHAYIIDSIDIFYAVFYMCVLYSLLSNLWILDFK